MSGAWSSFLSGADPKRLDEAREECPPVLTIQEHQLDDPDVAALLRGRVVLLGTQLDALNDTVLSPVHRRIPGVFLHAMALDNLMTWGEARLVKRPALSKVIGGFSALLLCVLIAWVVREHGGLRRRIYLIVVSALWVFVSTVILQVVFRQPPLDWIGSIALILGIFLALRAVSSVKE